MSTHGTYSHYNKHACRCYPCCLAASRYRLDLAERTASGAPRLVPADTARAHLAAWQEATGQGVGKFATLAGIGKRTVEYVRVGHTKTILPRTEAAFLAVPIDATLLDANVVATLPYRRRAQALAAIGYGLSEQSRRMGLSVAALRFNLTRDTIHRESARRIVALYDELHMKPIRGTHGAEQARRSAARKGWVPPLAWDDIDHDEHPACMGGDADDCDDAVKLDRILAGERLPATRAERLEVLDRWLATGRSMSELERIHGWNCSRDKKLAATSDSEVAA